MSGGMAYVYDRESSFKDKCNLGMVELNSPDEQDINTIKTLLASHYKYTSSLLAKKISDNLKQEIKYFVKVLPLEYKRILEEQTAVKKLDLGEYTDG